MKRLMDSHSQEENSLSEFLQSGKRFLIITGEVNSGKTSTVEQIISLLHSADKKIGGVFSKGTFIGSEKTGFNVIDVKSYCTKQLASIYFDKNFTISQGRYYFDPEVFKEFNNRLIQPSESDIIVIDEIGYLELYEKDFFPSIEFLINKSTNKIIFTVRKNLLEKIMNKFHLADTQVLILKNN